MRAEDIVTRICAVLFDVVVQMQDLMGTADHWKASIVSGLFAGKSLIERHRMVMAALAEELKGPIHALTLEVKTPEETER